MASVNHPESNLPTTFVTFDISSEASSYSVKKSMTPYSRWSTLACPAKLAEPHQS
jgi:hypothetical protein